MNPVSYTLLNFMHCAHAISLCRWKRKTIPHAIRSGKIRSVTKTDKSEKKFARMRTVRITAARSFIVWGRAQGVNLNLSHGYVSRYSFFFTIFPHFLLVRLVRLLFLHVSFLKLLARLNDRSQPFPGATCSSRLVVNKKCRRAPVRASGQSIYFPRLLGYLPLYFSHRPSLWWFFRREKKNRNSRFNTRNVLLTWILLTFILFMDKGNETKVKKIERRGLNEFRCLERSPEVTRLIHRIDFNFDVEWD